MGGQAFCQRCSVWHVNFRSKFCKVGLSFARSHCIPKITFFLFNYENAVELTLPVVLCAEINFYGPSILKTIPPSTMSSRRVRKGPTSSSPSLHKDDDIESFPRPPLNVVDSTSDSANPNSGLEDSSKSMNGTMKIFGVVAIMFMFGMLRSRSYETFGGDSFTKSIVHESLRSGGPKLNDIMKREDSMYIGRLSEVEKNFADSINAAKGGRSNLDAVVSVNPVTAPESPSPKSRQPPPEAELPSPSSSSKATYEGYTFWSSDFHISPIADLKDLFSAGPITMNIIDKSLSGHCNKGPNANKPTCAKDLKVINSGNGIDLGIKHGQCPNPIKRQFYNAYVNDPEMNTVDAFLCHHATPLCEVFMAFGRPMILVVSTRYEIGRYDQNSWKVWNDNLRAIAANPRNIIAANNHYDAEYVKYFTGLKEVPVIPNYCGYTNAEYNPTKTTILVGPGRGINDHLHNQLQSSASKANLFEFKRIRDLYPRFEYSDLAQHPAIVLIPYQVSIMSIFEYYRMGIPMFVPTPELLAKWQMEYRILSELTWDMVFSKPKDHSNVDGWRSEDGTLLHPFDPNNQFSEESIAFWVKWADFYMWPHIIQYSSFDELPSLIQKTDLNEVSTKIKEENDRMKADLFETWNGIFDRLFHGVEKGELGSDSSEKGMSWEEAMMDNYQIKVGQCGNGVPGQSNDNFESVDWSSVVV